MTRRLWYATVLAIFTLGCSSKKDPQAAIQTATVTRRNIIVTAQATGTVEPIDTVAVKSQASGLVIAMPVEVGTHVKPGDLIAQLDRRNLQNEYDRAVAAQAAAKASLTVTQAALRRANELYAQKVITADEHEAAVVNEANARSTLTSTQTTLKTARQNLEYATIRAEVAGTIINKNASIGTVVSSATANVGGGSTIVTIADLSRVRMRALVNETDVGNVRVGMPVTVTVDAFPNRTFSGQVEKVEPQATVQNSVTMFPVLVSLQNLDQALLPGMNGEVSIVTQDRMQVLAVPNDAVRSVRDIATVAPLLGISTDSIQVLLRARRNANNGNSGNGDRTARQARSRDTTAAFAGTFSNTPPQMVFVKEKTGWMPRRVRLGVSDYDYSEVLSGLNQGDQVALLGTAVVQAQREQNSARARSVTGGGLPGTGNAAGGRGAGGGGGRGGPP